MRQWPALLSRCTGLPGSLTTEDVQRQGSHGDPDHGLFMIEELDGLRVQREVVQVLSERRGRGLGGAEVRGSPAAVPHPELAGAFQYLVVKKMDGVLVEL